MNNKIQQAMQKIYEKEPLFTGLLAELLPTEAKNDVSTLATDGKRIYYNKDFVNKLTVEEAAATLIHEILHCAFLHPWRKDQKIKRDYTLWNVATDYAINGIVNELFKLPKDSLLDNKYYGMSAENIYDQLPKNKKGKQQEWCNHSMWGRQTKSQNTDRDRKRKLVEKIKDIFRFPKNKSDNDLEEENVEQKWEELFEKVFLRNYGKMPGSIQRLIEKSYYIPVINWTELLSHILSEDTTDYTFSFPDRRFLGQDFILPGMQSFDKVKDVIFAYDTSGSISNSDLHSFYIETLNLFNNFISLSGWIAVCDWDLHVFKPIDNYVSYDDFGFMGGGGTSFKPVFKKIQKEGLNPKAVFYFTDTEGEFPEEKPPYPVFWLVKSFIGDNYSKFVPFGKVIKFLSGS